jgi:anhydro-N-acetylmuramic acid kinase
MRALGLMSGTSADGVSAAVVETGPPLRVLEYRTLGFPPATRRRILALRDAAAGELCEANFWLGEIFARAARRMRTAYEVIGSHGQTVFHVPGSSTLQLGEPCVIAERTGRTVVADFRPRDIAAGGQGAPLVPHFDRRVFGGRRGRALLNIGGIANVTFPDDGTAFDTGPGNCLLDEAVRRMGRGDFDRGGRIAARGRVDLRLLDRWLRHPYFAKRPPKSTGRELFAWDFVGAKPTADVVATLTCLTARTIAEAVRRWGPPGLQEVVVSGGGVYNRTLLDHLRWLLWPAQPRPSTVYGLHPLAKEPAAFALLAVDTLRAAPNNVPSATGARRPVVLGKIVPGDNFRRLLRRLP